MRYCGHLSAVANRGCGRYFRSVEQHQRSHPTGVSGDGSQNREELLVSSVTPVQSNSIPLFSSPAIQYEILFLARNEATAFQGVTP